MRRRLWSRMSGALVAVLGAVVLPVAAVAPAQAAVSGSGGQGFLACGGRALSQPFSPYGDTNSYFLTPSGSFETGTSGWALGPGVGVTGGNEPWNLSGPGASSLQIPGGSSATTPVMCLAPNEESTRFFVKSPGSGSLVVTAKATDMTYGIVTTSSFTLNLRYPGWYMIPAVQLPNTSSRLGNQNVQITFATQGSVPWQIDDVYVDPSRTL